MSVRKLSRIDIECPCCGHVQKEPRSVRSTFCQRCSAFFEVVDDHEEMARGMRRQVGRLIAEARRPTEIAQQEIHCFECGTRQRASVFAQSTACPGCGAYIQLGDIEVDCVFTRRVQTRSRLIVHPHGRLISSKVVCQDVIVEGEARSDFTCTGTICVRAGGRLGGMIRCRRLLVEQGGVLERVKSIEADIAELDSEVSSRLIMARLVHVGPHGHLEGRLEVRSLRVDTGGRFSGWLALGKFEGAEEPEEPATTPDTPPEPPEPEPPLALAGEPAPGQKAKKNVRRR